MVGLENSALMGAIMDVCNVLDRARAREVSWRTCPYCKEDYPWRTDTPTVITICRACAVIIARKKAVAVTTQGNMPGKR